MNLSRQTQWFRKHQKTIIPLLAIASPFLLTGLVCLVVWGFSGSSIDGYTPASNGASGDDKRASLGTSGGGKASVSRTSETGGSGDDQPKSFGGSTGNLVGSLLKEIPKRVAPKDTPKDETPPPKAPPQKSKPAPPDNKKPGGSGTSFLGNMLSGGKQPPNDDPPPVTKKTPPAKNDPPTKTATPPWPKMKTAKLIDENSRKTISTFRIPEPWKSRSSVARGDGQSGVYIFQAGTADDEELFSYQRFDLTPQEFIGAWQNVAKLNIKLKDGYYLGPDELLSELIIPLNNQATTDLKITHKKVENIPHNDPQARVYVMELGLEYVRDRDSLRCVERGIVIMGCTRANGGRVDMMIYSLAMRNTPENKARIAEGLKLIAESRQNQ